MLKIRLKPFDPSTKNRKHRLEKKTHKINTFLTPLKI